MALRMKDLIRLTGESKSTILYYLKEGLLPEPQKPKPNVHLYDESCVERIRFIKYLQHHFNYSIAEIRSILEENRFENTEAFEMLVRALRLLSGDRQKRYDTEDFMELAQIDEATLQRWRREGMLFAGDGTFSEREVQIASILKRYEMLGVDRSLLRRYVECARDLAEAEFDAGAAAINADPEHTTEYYRLFFDLILIYKPYLFNSYTVEAYRRRYATQEEGGDREKAL